VTLWGIAEHFRAKDSTGKRIRRGGITKSGNAHLRRIVVESALELSPPASDRSPVAQATGRASGRDHRDCMESADRLHKRYMTLMVRGKEQRKTMTAIARETVGLYLGHRDQGRSGLQATNDGMKGTERTKAKTFQIRKKQKQINQ